MKYYCQDCKFVTDTNRCKKGKVIIPRPISCSLKEVELDLVGKEIQSDQISFPERGM